MFFVVDVETSNLSPWMPDGDLLSVGIVPVHEDGTIEMEDSFYQRVYNPLPIEWYNDDIETDNETLVWWRQQSEDAQREAYKDHGLIRYPLAKVCLDMVEWLNEVEPDKSQRYVAANPVAFDKMWLEYAFGVEDMDMPFHYRCLCLRSMKFGLDPNPEFGNDRSGHEPEFPHLAWSDAMAEAKDLQDMIYNKANSLRTFGKSRPLSPEYPREG